MTTNIHKEKQNHTSGAYSFETKPQFFFYHSCCQPCQWSLFKTTFHFRGLVPSIYTGKEDLEQKIQTKALSVIRVEPLKKHDKSGK